MKLEIPEGATKNRKRLGRGAGSGTGCTAGKGTKGQKARSGKKIRPGFEGGQMPLYRRLPQRGFSNYMFKDVVEEITLGDLNKKFKSGEVVNIETLHSKRLIAKTSKMAKVLNTGALDKALTIEPDVFTTKVALEKIIAAGGTVNKATSNEAQTKTQTPVSNETQTETQTKTQTETQTPVSEDTE